MEEKDSTGQDKHCLRVKECREEKLKREVKRSEAAANDKVSRGSGVDKLGPWCECVFLCWWANRVVRTGAFWEV